MPSETDNVFYQHSVRASYMPVKVHIMPLTEFTRPGDGGEMSGIKAYVSLLDEFDCQIKAPVVFRFELYEYVQPSAEPKGRRIAIWPDVDLTQAAANNQYWRDFLRAYQFNLDFVPQRNQSYILQVTSLCPTGKRLSAEFTLKN
ncbi:MAG: hypothetical protein JSV82_01465 [Planctomycetota bacterium]|nr:MAG: hypothetical protein JSV82_01465 [Planctomycetota bacterium]